MKKKFGLGILAAVVLLGVPLLAQAVTANTSNDVAVASCEQIGSDIRIRRANSSNSTVLTSACRNAGYGLRQYAVSCLSATKYRVSWSACAPAANKPPIADIQGPRVGLDGSFSGNYVNNSEVSYQLSLSVRDNMSNVKGVQIVVRDVNNQIVQTWWVDGGRDWSESNGFGSLTITRTLTHTGLRSGQTYYVTAQAWDVRGNSSFSNTVTLYTLSDTSSPTISADVNYSAQWYVGNSAKRMVPTLVARADDNKRIAKITLYYNNSGLGEGYSELRTCSIGATSGTCSYSFGDLTRGNFYAVAWDEAGNSVTSYKISF